MKMGLLMLILCVSSTANADVYLDVGAGYGEGYYFNHGTSTFCGYKGDTLTYGCVTNDNYEESSGFMGMVELGVNMGKYSVFLFHLSDIKNKDEGINLIGVKYRFTLYD